MRWCYQRVTARAPGADGGERLGEGEAAGVEGLAHDRALHPLRDEGRDGLEVRDRGDAARGDDRRVGGRAHLREHLEVGAGEHAITRHVRDDIAFATICLETIEQCPDISGVLGPATGGDGGTAHINADSDSITEFTEYFAAPFRVFDGCRAQIDSSAARREGLSERLIVTNSARKLDLDIDRGDDFGSQSAVIALAEGSVQIDQVDPLGAVVLPLLGSSHWRAVIRLGTKFTLHQPDCLTVNDIDGRKKF